MDAENTCVPIAKEPRKRGRSYNQALLQQRLLVALTEQYPPGFVTLPSVAIDISGQVLTPDLAVFQGAKRLLKPDVAVVTELPVLIVLVLSPSEAFDEQVKVAENYLEAGIASCWLVEPTLRAIFIASKAGAYQAFNHHETLRDPVTGIELELAQLFS